MWDVPVGGMGAVTGALATAARAHGAQIVTGAEVLSVTPDGAVRYRRGDDEAVVRGRFVLANVTLGAGRVARRTGPAVRRRLPGEGEPDAAPTAPPAGCAAVTPEQAFGGTFHINETWSQLDTAYAVAAAGTVPDPPCEIYCHSLSDPSILSPGLRASGAATLTVFGLHVPHRLQTGEPGPSAQRLTAAVLASLNSVLAEPVEDVVNERMRTAGRASRPGRRSTFRTACG